MEPRTAEAGVGAPTPEKPNKIEQRDSREKVLTAFNSAFSLLEKKPEDSLTPQEKWLRDSIKAAKEKSIDQGKDTFINTFKNPRTGESFSQDERIPTGELLTFLQKKAEDLKEYPVGSKQRQNLINIAHIIYRNSRPFYRFSDRMDQTRLEGRVDQEIAEGESKDRVKAIEDINTRLELILPKGKPAEKPIKKRAAVKKAVPKGKIAEPPTPPAESAGTTEGAETPAPTPTIEPSGVPAEGTPGVAEGTTPEAVPGEPPAAASEASQQSERVLSSAYNVNLGSQSEDARKLGEGVAEMRIEERSSEGFPTHLPQNRILRVGRLIAHGLNPRNWGRILFTNMKEYYRQIWKDQHYQELRDTNFGATNNLSQDAARRALAEIKSMRAAGKEVVKRMEIGGVRAGEVGPTEIQGAFKDYIVNQVLKPVVSGLKPLLPNEAANQDQINGIENDIQKKLFDYVSAHQNDAQITEFFGRNVSQYGDLSEFYASDIMETARRIIIDERADQFQQGQLDNIIHVRIFRATWGEQTEIRRSAADRLMAWAEKNRVRGALINPATVGLATSALTFLGIRAGLGVSKYAIPLSGLITGPAYAALRNDWDLREQRIYASRQQEAGGPRETAGTGTRREIVERSLMNMATPGELIGGGGQEIIAGGVERQSIADMITRGDDQGLLRRYGEIMSRLDFAKLPVQTRRFIFFNQSNPSGIGLIKYEAREKMEHGATELITQALEIRGALSQKGFTPENLNSSVDTWNRRFIENKQEMDAMFNRYKLGSDLAATGGAAVIGLGLGLGLQEGIALGGRALGQNVGPTVVEQLPFLKGIYEATKHTQIGGGPGSVEAFKNLYEHPGATDFGDHFKGVVGQDHSVSITDAQTNQPVPGKFTIDADGHLHSIGQIQDSLRTELENKGFTITPGQDVVEQSTIIDHKPVLGPEGEWTNHATNIDHREWYSYDQPGSQGNELHQYNFKNGRIVTLDLSTMHQAFQRGLNPNPIDVQQVIKDGQAGFYVTMGDAQNHGLWIPDSADGVIDGKVALNPDDWTHMIDTPNGKIPMAEAARMIVNQDALQKLADGNIATELRGHQDVFNLNHGGRVGFIEAGRTVDINGTKNLQAFATIHGTHGIPETIDITKVIETRTPTFEMIPPQAIPLPEQEPAIFPFPLGPREPMANVLFLAYGLGYQSREGLGWVPENEYTTRRSKTLNANPQAQLDESQEVADYLSRLNPAYREELEGMDLAIGSPMSAETRAVITIPAFGEGKIIKKTLEQFLNQKNKDGSQINPTLFEIIVYENDTTSRPKDETEDQIKKFKAEHPEIKVHYAYKRWTQADIDNKINTVGNGRKYSCDLALLRSSKRTARTGDLIVVNNDADLEGITPKYIADAVEEFDTQDYLDYVVGKRNLPDWALEKPNIRAGQRMWETFDAVMRHAGDGGGMNPTKRRRGWPGMIGENSAMRASIYAAVGGYGPKAHLAEDQNLGDMIRVARQYDDRRFKYINRLETIKNPRRYLTTMITGRPLVDMYNDYHENKNIRNQNNQQLLSQIPDTFDVSRFQLDADSFYQKKAQGAYGNLSQEEFNLIFQRAMRFMGAGYVIENGHVKITNAERLLKGLGAKRPTTKSSTSRSRAAKENKVKKPISSSKKAAEVLNDAGVRKKRLDELRELREERERKKKPQATERLQTEAVREEPKDLLGKINKTLTETAGTSAHYETSPQELVDYLKTFKLPVGKLKTADAKIINNELVVNGLISVPFGEATFDVTLANDETGGIRVKRHDLVLSGSAGAARGKVEEYIANLNAKLATRINREIDPAWETNKFYITPDKLAIDFKKKPQTT